MISGSSNGSISVWDLKYKSFIKLVTKDDSGIEHIRALTKLGSRCIVVTSKPEISVHDLNTG